MRRPYDLVAFMKQEERAVMLDNLKKELLSRKDEIDKSEDRDTGKFRQSVVVFGMFIWIVFNSFWKCFYKEVLRVNLYFLLVKFLDLFLLDPSESHWMMGILYCQILFPIKQILFHSNSLYIASIYFLKIFVGKSEM